MMTIVSSCRSVSQSSADQSENKTYLQKSFGDGEHLEFYFQKGKHHNYPSFAIWIETLDGETVQTLFVTESVGTGYYKYGDAGDGHWLKVPGPAVRPASLPYWLHRREIGTAGKMPSPDYPLPDAYTGATPSASFNMKIQLNDELPERFKVLVEVNQPWDWNKYWTNSKFNDNPQYLTSSQPAIVYAVEVDLSKSADTYYLNPIGHSHYAGADGMLYTNLKTFTTALEIFDSIMLKIKK
jgi:hypothetical protein